MSLNVQTGTSAITTLINDDIIYIARTSDSSDKSISKQNLDSYINTVINETFTTVTINDGITEIIQMGEVASYEGFEIEAMLGNSTARAKIFKEFVYDNSTLKGYSPRVTGTLEKDPAVLDINQQAISFGQAIWKIVNNTGNTITVKYRVKKYPAI